MHLNETTNAVEPLESGASTTDGGAVDPLDDYERAKAERLRRAKEEIEKFRSKRKWAAAQEVPLPIFDERTDPPEPIAANEPSDALPEALDEHCLPQAQAGVVEAPDISEDMAVVTEIIWDAEPELDEGREVEAAAQEAPLESPVVPETQVDPVSKSASEDPVEQETFVSEVTLEPEPLVLKLREMAREKSPTQIPFLKPEPTMMNEARNPETPEPLVALTPPSAPITEYVPPVSAAREAAPLRSVPRSLSRREKPKAKLKRQHFLNQWPLLVWAVAIGVAMMIHFGFVKETPIPGEVGRTNHLLPASDTGTVATVSVSQWERVEAGRELIAVSSRKLQEDLAELDAKLAARLVEQQALARNRIVELKLATQERQIELEALEKERKILSDQVEAMNALVSAEGESPLVSRFFQHSDFAERLAESSSELIKVESKLAKETIAKERDAAALAIAENEAERLQTVDAVSLATAEESGERRQLLEQIEALVVRSPVAGYVAVLYRTVGERVEDGEALVEIVEDPRWIEVQVPAERSADLKAGSPLWIQRTDSPAHVFELPVLKVAPVIAVDGVQARTQAVFVECATGSGFVPGQEVRAYLDNPKDSRLVVFGREFRRSFQNLVGTR